MQAGLTEDGHEGHGLERPECVLAHASGWLLVPCWAGAGGVDFVRGSTRRRLLASGSDALFGESLRPNGIALDARGRLLLAHLGATRGAVVELDPTGGYSVIVNTVDGESLPPANFVVADRRDRLWITVSTRLTPRALDYRRTAASGFIAVLEPGSSEARIVADGLGYTNECVVDEERGRLYVNETFARRLTAFDLAVDGSLSQRRTLATFGRGIYPDGLALDADGALWVSSIVSNTVLRVWPDGRVETVLDESDPAHVAWTEDAWASDALARPHLDTVTGERLRNVSSLAFGGDDLRSVWCGSLHGDTLPRYRSEVAGVAMVHRHAPLDAFTQLLDATD